MAGSVWEPTASSACCWCDYRLQTAMCASGADRDEYLEVRSILHAGQHQMTPHMIEAQRRTDVLRHGSSAAVDICHVVQSKLRHCKHVGELPVCERPAARSKAAPTPDNKCQRGRKAGAKGGPSELHNKRLSLPYITQFCLVQGTAEPCCIHWSPSIKNEYSSWRADLPPLP